MDFIEITLHLPELLVKQATQMGILTDEHISNLLRAEIEAQLALMANDPDIQRELAQINDEFRVAEWDGLHYNPIQK
ncbi:MAG TPA: hypothetical protein PLZ51_23955 [Aggregatilineales bacterium]|nr:hypothetical protein [Aggregatilineales bacterium]